MKRGSPRVKLMSTSTKTSKKSGSSENSRESRNCIGKEIQCLTENKLTSYDKESGHYEVYNQRSAFYRCQNCVNLSEADCYNDEDGNWVWHKECLFCIQRVIDMLGYFEHGIVPNLSLHDTPKKREQQADANDLYAMLGKVAKNIDKLD